MRKYKQGKEKKVVYSLDEWEQIEERAVLALIKRAPSIIAPENLIF